jgi:polysaccharide export outer membrane protein
VFAPGDQVEVFVRRVPEVSRTLTVRPDGYITLPLLDDVKAAGLTATELKETLRQRFSTRLVDPEVTVIAIQVPPPVVYVIGDVGNNLAIPLRSAHTAIDAIAYAGGFRRSAKSGDTTIIRLGEDGQIRAIPLSNLAGGQAGPVIGLRSLILEPDDIVFVPESGRSQVNRFLDDIVNRPLATLTAAFGVYVNFRLIRVIAEQER